MTATDAIPAAAAALRRCAALLCCVLFCAAAARAETVVLYEQPSRYANILVTQEPDGLRTLRFERGGARQSVVKVDDPGYLALPYARVALVGLGLCEDPRRILVVGLGGGTLPRFLHKYFPEATIDAVDIDADVLHVSRQFFGFTEDERMRAYIADGRRYIEQTRTPYDVIFLDAFGASSVPAHMTTREFLEAARRAVRADGVVVGNVWSGAHNALYASMVRTYEAVFDTVKVVRVGGTGNRIVLALPRKEALETEALARRASRVAATRRFDFDPAAGMAEQTPDEREAIRAARVLHD